LTAIIVGQITTQILKECFYNAKVFFLGFFDPVNARPLKYPLHLQKQLSALCVWKLVLYVIVIV